MNIVKYEVNLYLKGTLVGDIRAIAENLKWTRKRTQKGVDSIDFSVNDKLLSDFLEKRNYNIKQILKPYALECRLKRNGVEVIGGFLATMPAYSPLKASGQLSFSFDGYLNLLAGVYIRNKNTNLPLGTINGPAGTLIKARIDDANTISSDGGAGFNLTSNTIETMASITETFDSYKTVKDWICERADNATGAGKFDIYFYADKRYDIIKDENFGHRITDWTAEYPTKITGAGVTSISANEVGGFTSAVFGLGAGETSAITKENTALNTFIKDNAVAREFGYVETLYQDSSITKQTTLNNNTQSKLNNNSIFLWQPEITLHGRQVAPTPNVECKIWIGDTITVRNTLDLTGMMNGEFRVQELSVDVSPAGDETIKPALERV